MTKMPKNYRIREEENRFGYLKVYDEEEEKENLHLKKMDKESVMIIILNLLLNL